VETFELCTRARGKHTTTTPAFQTSMYNPRCNAQGGLRCGKSDRGTSGVGWGLPNQPWQEGSGTDGWCRMNVLPCMWLWSRGRESRKQWIVSPGQGPHWIPEGRQIDKIWGSSA